MKYLVCSFFLLGVFLFLLPAPTQAVVDPLVVANNKFGIHIISPTPDEASPAASLVNSHNGDWGYVTVLIESKDKNHDKWQTFFNDLRRRHLIPLVRLATYPEGSFWKRPDDGEAQVWADFLDTLNWPTKNRYVIIYNEPNQAQEWGNFVDPVSYAKTLNLTIDALKKKNPDFFILNAGFDASAPEKRPLFASQHAFMSEMNQAVPGIFNKLDGWASHSYPNPGFVGSPYDLGRGTTSTWIWEMRVLKQLGVTKNLPVFVTETGWKHAEGINFDKSLPDTDTISKYYEYAFTNTWASSQIVAVTPFLLNYQEDPFDHFSFKKITGEKQNIKILGLQFPEYYSPFQTIAALTKKTGKPVQENKFQITKGEIFTSIVANEVYQIPLTIKNTGQSIWNDGDQVRLIAENGGLELGVKQAEIPLTTKIEPGQEYTLNLPLQAPFDGKYQLKFNLYSGTKAFDDLSLEYTIEVKQPVILKVRASLKWKTNFAGKYILNLSTAIGEMVQDLILGESGQSREISAKYLLPDYSFNFTLEKPYYKSKTINQKVKSGINTLDFGVLEPDYFSALFYPKKLWEILPWSGR